MYQFSHPITLTPMHKYIHTHTCTQIYSQSPRLPFPEAVLCSFSHYIFLTLFSWSAALAFDSLLRNTTPPWEMLVDLTFSRSYLKAYVLSFWHWIGPTHYLETCWKHQQHRITIWSPLWVWKIADKYSVMPCTVFPDSSLFEKGESQSLWEKRDNFGPKRWKHWKWQLLL